MRVELHGGRVEVCHENVLDLLQGTSTSRADSYDLERVWQRSRSGLVSACTEKRGVLPEEWLLPMTSNHLLVPCDEVEIAEQLHSVKQHFQVLFVKRNQCQSAWRKFAGSLRLVFEIFC